jgi:hypothetical protein
MPLSKPDLKTLESNFELTIAKTKSVLIRWIIGIGLLQITIITALVFIMTGKI